ncbi:MAG: GrpB family protein [Phycisphaeraceae bacterium]
MSNAHWPHLGLAKGVVRLAEYSPDWPRTFERERERILAACGDHLHAIEHVGSTSVPGLIAKPVLDIMPALRTPQAGEAIIEPMTALGYEYRGAFGLPGRFFFVLRSGDDNVVHCHAWPREHPQVRRHVAFRDYLRAHPEAAAEYAALKRKLAGQHETDREAYTDAKDEFIQRIDALALKRGVTEWI